MSWAPTGVVVLPFTGSRGIQYFATWTAGVVGDRSPPHAHPQPHPQPHPPQQPPPRRNRRVAGLPHASGAHDGEHSAPPPQDPHPLDEPQEAGEHAAPPHDGPHAADEPQEQAGPHVAASHAPDAGPHAAGPQEHAGEHAGPHPAAQEHVAQAPPQFPHPAPHVALPAAPPHGSLGQPSATTLRSAPSLSTNAHEAKQ